MFPFHPILMLICLQHAYFCFPLVSQPIFPVHLLVTLARLSAALHNLSCNAAPGALLNLLLLAGRPGSINKPWETMERLNEHHTRIVAHHEGTGRPRPPPSLHFLCHRRESSIIILLHSILHASIPTCFSHFHTSLPC